VKNEFAVLQIQELEEGFKIKIGDYIF